MRTEEIVAVMEEKRGKAINLSQLKEDVEREFNAATAELRLRATAALRQYKADMSQIDANKLPDNVRQQIDLAKEVCETIDSINITFVNEADKLMMFIEALNTEFTVPERNVQSTHSLKYALDNFKAPKSSNPRTYTSAVDDILAGMTEENEPRYQMLGRILRRAFFEDLIPEQSNPNTSISSSSELISTAIASNSSPYQTTALVNSDVLNGTVLPHTRKNTERVVFCVDMLDGTITPVGLWGMLSHTTVRADESLSGFLIQMHDELEKLYNYRIDRTMSTVDEKRNNRDLIYLKMLIARGETPRQIIEAMFPRCGFWTGEDYTRLINSSRAQNSVHPHVGADSNKMCLGNAGSMFSTQLTEMNYLGVILIISEFLRAVNLGDSAGSVFSYFPTTALTPEEYIKAVKGDSKALLNLNTGLSIRTNGGKIVTVDEVNSDNSEFVVNQALISDTIRETSFIPRRLIGESMHPLTFNRETYSSVNKFVVRANTFDFDTELYMFSVDATDTDTNNEFTDRYKTENLISTTRGVFILQDTSNYGFIPWERYLLSKGYSSENVRNTSWEIDDDGEMLFTCEALEPTDAFLSVSIDTIKEYGNLTDEFLKFSELARKELYEDVIATLNTKTEVEKLVIGSSHFIPNMSDGDLLRSIKLTIIDSADSYHTRILRNCIGDTQDQTIVDKAEFVKLSGGLVRLEKLMSKHIIEFDPRNESREFIARYGWVAPFYVYQFNEADNTHEFVPVQYDMDDVVDATLKFLLQSYPNGVPVLRGTGIYTKGFTGNNMSNQEGMALLLLGGDVELCTVQDISPDSADRIYNATTHAELTRATDLINAVPRNVERFNKSLYATVASENIQPSYGNLRVFSTSAETVVITTNPLIRALSKWVNLITSVYDTNIPLFEDPQRVVNIPPRWFFEQHTCHRPLHEHIHSGLYTLSPQMVEFYNTEKRMVNSLTVRAAGACKFRNDARFTEDYKESLANNILSNIRFHHINEIHKSDNYVLKDIVWGKITNMAVESIGEILEEFNTFGTVFTFHTDRNRRRNAYLLNTNINNVSTLNDECVKRNYSANVTYDRYIKPFKCFTPEGVQLGHSIVRSLNSLEVLLPKGLKLDNHNQTPIMYNEQITYLKSTKTGESMNYLVGTSRGATKYSHPDLNLEMYPVFVGTKTLGNDKYNNSLFVRQAVTNNQSNQINTLVRLLFAFCKVGIDTSSVEEVLKAHIKDQVAQNMSNNKDGILKDCVYSPIGRTMVDSHTAALITLIMKQSTNIELSSVLSELNRDKLMAGSMLGRLRSDFTVLANKTSIPPQSIVSYLDAQLFLDEDPTDDYMSRVVFRNLIKTINATGAKKAEKINKAFDTIVTDYVSVTHDLQDITPTSYNSFKNNCQLLSDIPELILKGGK